VDFAAAAAAINPDSRPVPERRILPLLLPSTRTADPCRNGGSCRRCCCHQPGQPTRAGTVDFAAAAAGALEPDHKSQMFHVEQPGQPTRAGTEDPAAAAAAINPDSRPVPERWIFPLLNFSFFHNC